MSKYLFIGEKSLPKISIQVFAFLIYYHRCITSVNRFDHPKTEEFINLFTFVTVTVIKQIHFKQSLDLVVIFTISK